MLTLEQSRLAARFYYDAKAIQTEVAQWVPSREEEAASLIRTFLDAEGRYHTMMIYDQNAALYQERKQKPKRASYMGGAGTVGIGNSRMPGGQAMAAFYRLDQGTDDDWETEKRDTQEAWDRVESKQLAGAEKNLLDAMNALQDFLEGMPELAVFLKGYPVRLSRHKYEEGVRLTRDFPPSDQEFKTGMEYFARLGSRRDAKEQYKKAEKKLHWYQTKMALIEVPVAVVIVLMVVILATMPNIVPPMLLAAVLVALAGSAVIQLVIQVVLLLKRHGYYNKLRTEHPYTGNERMWELDDEK